MCIRDRSIANAVMGTDGVRRAKADLRCANSDAKQLRALYKRLLSCIVEGAPLPRNFLESAVHHAEAPVSYTHLDVYKRQPSHSRPRLFGMSCSDDWTHTLTRTFRLEHRSTESVLRSPRDARKHPRACRACPVLRYLPAAARHCLLYTSRCV